MILQTEPLCQSQNWQQALADVIRDPLELFNFLKLDKSQLPAAIRAGQDFPLRVPRAFAERMEKGNWGDPLLQQVLPTGQELEIQPGFQTDPLDEAGSNPAPGLIHKYHGRVLLIVSGGCAINCRYCFRRHFPYGDNNPSRQAWAQTLQYIANDSSINEVIFSGGDPLAASDKVLAELVEQIAQIPHVKTLRLHTRLPIVIPQRIDENCLQWLSSSRLRTVMVIHSNHSQELDDNVRQALSRLSGQGVTLLNQSVLLAGINDSAKALTELSHKLFDYGVLPYYLHLLDRVKGAAHFDVSESQAQQLIKQMMDQLPGYLVPKLVREQAGASSKIAIAII